MPSLTCRPWILALLVVALALPVRLARAADGEDAAGAAGAGEGGDVGEDEPDPGAGATPAAFPDPLLMRQARTQRAVGATLSIAAVAATVVNLNLALAALRSGNERARAAVPYYTIPLAVVMVAGLEVGAPLWSVGSEMHRQLTRHTRGDEKLRRGVANDPRYWRGRRLNAFGTAMALTGGLSVAIGSLVLVAGIWVNQQFGEEVAEVGTARVWSVAGPAIMLGAGMAGLIGGLRMRKAGIDQSQRVRDAYATALLVPVPYVDPVGRGGGLALAGVF